MLIASLDCDKPDAYKLVIVMETKQCLVVQHSAKDGKLVLDVHLTIVHTLAVQASSSVRRCC